MRIGINLVPLFPGKIGGAEQYVRNVIGFLEKEPGAQVHLFLNDQAFDTFGETEQLRKHRVDIYQDMPPQLDFLIDENNLDVWFCPIFDLSPCPCHIPAVTSILDIQQEYYPENFSRRELAQRKKSIAQGTEHSDRILTISEYSKQTLMEKFGVPGEKITVTYLDADSSFDAPILPERQGEVKAAYGLPESYILYPANSWPHKNHLRLLEAYAKLKKEKGIREKLVFTGAKKENQKDVERKIRKWQIEEDVVYLGYIAQQDMPYVFAGASLLAFPSLFEGFGIPLLEAMRVGLPIAASRVTSIPEICGESALYFDPLSPEDMAEKIAALLGDASLRASLAEKGRERARAFSWERCARETLSALRSVAAKGPERSPGDEWPLISVITPSYNQGPFIRDTIESILSQDYPNIEYLVMDGGSTDETVSILKSYGDRIQWVSERDGGQADAVNKGIQRARGKYIGWLNSDDTYLPGAIRAAVSYLEARPFVDVVYGEGYHVDREGKILDRYPTEKFSLKHLAEDCFICQPTAFIRKSILDQVGGLDASRQLCMDYELWMKIGHAGHMAYTPKYLATSRMYEENKTLSRKEEVYTEIFETVTKYYGYLPMSWIYGYLNYRYQEHRTVGFWLKTYVYLFRHNRNKPEYAVEYTYRSFRHKIGKTLRKVFPRKAEA